MTEKKKFCIYVNTFPSTWTRQFVVLHGITDATSYASIDEFMQQQTDDADCTKKSKKKKKEKRRPHLNDGRNNNRNNSKYKMDPNAKSGLRARYGKHPNSNHY